MQSLTKGFGIIGIILLLFGIIALALTKLANWYFYVHIGLGVAFIILYFVFNFDSFVDRIKERSTTEGSKVFIYAAIVILIIVGINVVSFRKSKRWDLTANKVFSLEEQTISLITNLPAPVKFTGFFHTKNPAKEGFKQLLKAYRYRSDKIEFEVVDPDKQPDLATQYKVKDGDIRVAFGFEDTILGKFDEAKIEAALKQNVAQIYFFGENPDDADYKKLKVLLSKPEYASRGMRPLLRKYTAPPPIGLQASYTPKKGDIYLQFTSSDTIIQAVSEETFTNAIIQVNRQDNPTIYFVTGHGELDISDEGERGLSILKGAIQNEGYDVRSMTTNLVQGVPSDADMIIIAGIQTSYAEAEANAVNRFLENGGKAVIMIDPNFSNPKLNPEVTIQRTGMEDLLAKWGLALGFNVVLEKHQQLFSGPSVDPYVIARNYGSHEIVQPLGNVNTFFNVSRSVSKLLDASSDLKITELVKSADRAQNSWAETDLTALIKDRRAEYEDKKDVSGPVSLAAAVERPNKQNAKKSTKLAVFGDADFVANRFIRSHEYNYDLFLNTLNWMWGKKEQIAIRPKRLRSSKLLLTPDQTNKIFYSAVLTLPELVLIIGLAIYWRRKSR